MMLDTAELDKALEGALVEREIYNIDNFGWVSEDEVDPEYSGFPMWWMTPPYEEDFNAWQHNVAPEREPTTEQEWLMTLGSDFFALMKAARHSLGWVILYREDAVREYGAPNAFEFFEMNALVTLNTAADRLRDFLIWGVLRERPRWGHELDQWRLSLCTTRLASLHDEATNLEAAAEPLADLRKRRNAAIHNIAMETARMQRQRLKVERQARREGAWPGRIDVETYAEMIEANERIDRERREELDRRIDALARDYNALVKLGSETLHMEYRFRSRERSRG